ncbi:MAG: hypothetical protein C0603_06330 [Denitrovibrio sp.]|nr:MAG: hypothetical protein C0603_06330 [Denitrovibrio sp.]
MSTNKILIMLIVLFSLTLPLYAAEPIKFAYYDNYAPRSFVKDGKLQGILIDVVNEALVNRMGIEVKHEGFPWARAQALVEKGSSDAFITVPTTKRKTYTKVSKEPVLLFQTYLATASDNPKLSVLKTITSLDQLKNYVFVDYYGNGFSKKLLKDMTVNWLPDYKAIYRFLVQKKADVMIVSRKGIYSIEELGFKNQITVLPYPMTSVAFHLCINNNSKYVNILDKFDMVIKQMHDDGTIDKIIRNYY